VEETDDRGRRTRTTEARDKRLGRCQSKFYTACFAHQGGLELHCFCSRIAARSAEFNAENRLYSFALTMPRMLSFGQIAPRQMTGPHPPDFVLLC
jgi:hypothetical protein